MRPIKYPKLCQTARGRACGEYHGCERCRMRVGSDRHHIKGRIGDLLNDINYIIYLCRNCHDYIHQKDNTIYMQADLIRIVKKNIKKV